MLLSVATGVIYCRSWGPRKLGWDFVTSAPSDGLNALGIGLRNVCFLRGI